MMMILRTIVLLLAAACVAGCDFKPGPDAISTHPGGDGSGSAANANCTAFCHQQGGAAGFDPLSTNGSGTAGKHIAHVTSCGLSCERCHSGYANNPNHMNGIIEGGGNGTSPVIFDYLNGGSATFTYVSGPPAAGNCFTVRCHVDSGGSPTTMNWYGPDVPFVLPNCSACHGVPVGIRRQVLGTAGDFASNPSVTSHHVYNPLNADPSTAQCKLCHSQYQHMAGTVQLNQAATGSRVTYSQASPTTLEPFCLGCHNISGAAFTFVAGGSPFSPFNDGSTMGTVPYVASITIASSWTGSSTHRSRGLTCAGTGVVSTGCHGSNGSINMHGSTVRGLLANTMNFRIPLSSESAYTANRLVDWSDNNYKLCFDCHASYPNVSAQVVLGYRSGGVYDILKAPSPPAYSTATAVMQSLFRDRYIATPPYPASWGGSNQPYNDGLFIDPYLPLHNYHLLGFENRNFVPPGVNALQWKYRGDPGQIGRISCTACHNVHGTVVPTIRSTHVELGLQRDYFWANLLSPPVPGDGSTSLDALFADATALSYPLNCAIACHKSSSSYPPSYWHTPNGD